MSKSGPAETVFSFIVPVRDEQEVLPEFHRRLTEVAQTLGEPYEVIYVNDGSRDGSGELLRGLRGDDERVKIVELSRNFGHQAALSAGYDFARARAIISLDADCQHPPEVVPELVARWRDGAEVVNTFRDQPVEMGWWRRTLSRFAHWCIRSVTGADLHGQADFRLLDAKAVEALKAHREHARCIAALVRHIGFNQVSVKYTPEARRAGRAGYSAGQLFDLATAAVLNFSLKPLRAVPLLGAALVLAVVAFTGLSLVLWPFGLGPGPWTRLTMALVFLFGLQLIALGLIGEYVGRTFEQAKGRPLYVIREAAGFDAPETPAARGRRAEDEESSERINIFT